MLCAGAAAQGRTRGLNFFVWNFAWDRLASRLYAATATTFLMKTWTVRSSAMAVAVFKVTIFGTGGGYCFKLFAVCRLYSQVYGGQFFFIKSMCIEAVCQLLKKLHTKLTVPYTNGVSAEWRTSRLRHRWLHWAEIHLNKITTWTHFIHWIGFIPWIRLLKKQSHVKYVIKYLNPSQTTKHNQATALKL